MIIIDIEKKLKAYGGQQVLKIAREFTFGSITKIYGRSGAGKTTFLKIIAGLTDPEKGKITFGDAVWFDSATGITLSPQMRKTGFVFQNYALFPNMTVLQHLQYATDDEQWTKQLLQIGKLDTLTGHKPGHLSGGQQQRLAILRAMAIKPKLLLMDEPFSGLDPEMRTELIANLRRLWKELQTTVLIVSHNPQELEGLTDNGLYITSSGET